MRSDQDENLLFGFLALQIKAVSSDGLLQGLQTWADDPSSSLGDVLCRDSLLTEEMRLVLNALVQARLAAAEGNAEESLSQFQSVDEFQDLMQRLSQHGFTNSWDRRASGQSTVTIPKPTNRQSTDRFQIMEFHEEGGLGRVYVAHDTELGRRVALKELKTQSADHEESRQRFVLEAEITGGLEHPGIVPVYGLGEYADGRPYYAMRFIEGGSFLHEIKAFHQSRAKSPHDRSKHNLQLRRLLQRFIDVCQAVDYAHSRGVLHRDLKPANIMVGEYGETLVVDWGLAKWQHQQDAHQSNGERNDDSADSADSSRPALLPQSGSEVAPTIDGMVVGTTAFMSPEQANGEVTSLGPATDIFGLGATLFYLLADKGPYQDSPDTLQAARTADVQSLPKKSTLIAKPLRSICSKALSRRPGDRYATASELAKDVERYLADERVLAHRETRSEKLRRLARRHRAWFQAAVAALLLISVISTASLAAVNHSRNAAIQSDSRTSRVLDYLVDAFGSADPSRSSGRDVTVASQLEQAERKIDQDFPAATDPIAKARLLGAIAKTYRGLGMYSESSRLFSRVVGYQRDALGEKHPDTMTAMHELAWSEFEADENNTGQSINRVVRLRTEVLGYHHPDTWKSIHQQARWRERKFGVRDALPYYQEVYELREAHQGPQDHETIVSLSNLAFAYYRANDSELAIDLFRDCLERHSENGTEEQSHALRARHGLSSALFHSERWEEAFDSYETGGESCERVLGSSHPLTLTSLHNLATAYLDIGLADMAIPIFEDVLRKRRAILGAAHFDTQMTRRNLAAALMWSGRLSDSRDLLANRQSETHSLSAMEEAIETLWHASIELDLKRPQAAANILTENDIYQLAATPPLIAFYKLTKGRLQMASGDREQGKSEIVSAYEEVRNGIAFWPIGDMWYADAIVDAAIDVEVVDKVQANEIKRSILKRKEVAAVLNVQTGDDGE